MGVKILNNLHDNSFRSEQVDWLIGNTGDWQKKTIDISTSVEFIGDTTNKVSFEEIGKIKLLNGRTWASYGFKGPTTVTWDRIINGVFSSIGLNVVSIYGDIMETTQTSWGNPPPVVPGSGGGGNGTAIYSYTRLWSDVRIEGIEIDYQHLSNDDFDSTNLISFIDGTKTIWNAKGLNVLGIGGSVPMEKIGNQSGMSIRGMNVSYNGKFNDNEYRYTVEIEYMISSFFDTVENIELGVFPSETFDANSLTDNVFIKGFPIWNNPNVRIESIISETKQLGNTGWFDENFNGLDNDFEVTKIEYYNPLGDQITEIDYGNTTGISIEVEGIQNLTPGSSRIGVGFIYLPKDEDDYKVNEFPFHENCRINTGGDGINDYYLLNSSYPVRQGYSPDGSRIDFQAVQILQIGIDKIRLDGFYTPTPEFTSFIESKSEENRKYMVWISVADQNLDTNDSNRVALRVDVNNMKLAIADAGPYPGMTNTFLEHHETVADAGVEVYSGYVEDDILANIQFLKDITNGEELVGQSFCIEAKKTATGLSYELETTNVDFSSFPSEPDGTKLINFESERGFKLVDGNNKNLIEVKRKTDIDAGDNRGYRSLYAWKIRWEDWIERSDAPSDFVDALLKQNGKNNDWYHYISTVGYVINLVVKTRVLDSDGELKEYNNEYLYNFKDYEDNEKLLAEHNYFRHSDNTTLNNGVDIITGRPLGVIIEGEFTRIEIDYTLINGRLWDISEVGYATICIEVDEGSGYKDFRQLSSLWGSEVDNPLKPITGSLGTKIELLVGAETIKTSCLIDPDILKNAIRYKISGRIGCGTAVVTEEYVIDSNEEILDESTGIWDIEFDLKDGDNNSLPSGYIFEIQIFDEGSTTVVGSAQYLIGQVIGVDAPISETGLWVAMKNHFSPVSINDGSVISFEKLTWGMSECHIKNPFINDARDLIITFQVKNGPLVSNVAQVNLDLRNTGNSRWGSAMLTSTNITSNEIVIADRGNDRIRAIDPIDGTTGTVGNITSSGLVVSDSNEIVNGKKVIYGATSAPFFAFPLRKYTWDVVLKSWVLIGTEHIFTARGVQILATDKGKLENGKSVIWWGTQAGTTPGSTIPQRYNERFGILKYNGSSWDEIDFSIVIQGIFSVETPTDINFSSWGIVVDTLSRVYFHMRGLGSTKNTIYRLTLNLGGDYFDPNDWSWKLMIGGAAGDVNGTGSTARFEVPRELRIIGYDGVIGAVSGTNPIIILADGGNNVKIKILEYVALTDEYESTTKYGSTVGYSDGIGTAALFNFPEVIENIDSNRILIAERGNNKTVRVADLTTEAVTTIGGETGGTGAGYFEKTIY